MALKHDAQGFLVGDPIDLSDLVSEWAAIRDDVRAIRQAVLGIEKAMSRVTPDARGGAVVPPGRESRLEDSDPAVKAMAEVAQPMAALRLVERTSDPVKGQQADMARPSPSVSAIPARGGTEKPIPVILRAPALPQMGGAVGNAARREPGDAGAVVRAVAELRAARPVTLRAPVEPARRDGRGRFVKGDVAGRPEPRREPGGVPRGEDDGEPDESLVRSISERIAGAVKEAGAGLEDSDPAVKAMTEVAQPMVRGYEVLTGGDRQKKQEGWLRRIYGSLTGFRKEEGLFNKVAAKRLKAIEEKPIADGDGGAGMLGGILGLLGGLLAKIPGLGKLLPAAAAGAAGAGAAGAGRKPAGGRSPGRFGRMLRRVPVLGALIGGAGLAGDLYESENDDTQTRGEKDRRAGRGVGGLAGSLGGMAAGAKMGALAGSLGGPIGAAIGGFVGGAVGMFLGDQAGQIIGEKVGSWVSSLREADIPGKIVAAWDSTVEFFKGGWSSIEGAAVGAWDWVKSGWDSVAGSIKEGWGTVTGAIRDEWDSMSDSMRLAWDGALSRLEAGWQAVKDAGNEVAEWAGVQTDAANDFVKDKLGIDVKGGLLQAWSYVSDAASTAGEAVVSAGSVVVDKAIEIKDKAVELGGRAVDAAGRGAAWAGENTTVGRAAVRAWDGAKSLGGWVLGQTSKAFESGRGGAGTVSSGRGDFGGASYGTYQLSSTQGTLQKFLDSSGYGAQFAGLKPGTEEFNAKWKGIAESDPTFGDAQHSFIQATHYDPALSGLREAGLDLSQRGAAVQDAIWSSSVQFGAGSASRGTGAIGMFQKALAGRDVAAMSDRDIVTAIQDYKINNNDRLFASSSSAVRAGTARRAVEEKERLIALAGMDAQATIGSASGAQETAVAAAPATSSPAGDIRDSSIIPASRPPAQEGPVSPAAPVLAQAVSPIAPALSIPSSAVVASAAVPAVPAAPISPPVAEAPPVQVPMSSGDSRKPVAVVAAPVDVGQDLRERGIAHIATGGLSGGGAG